MENGGPVVGLDAPTAKSDVVELDNRDRGLEAADFLFARFPSSWQHEFQPVFLRVGNDPLRALRRAPRHRLFTHFSDGGKRRRSSPNQFWSIVTCRSPLAPFGCSSGTQAMMRYAAAWLEAEVLRAKT